MSDIYDLEVLLRARSQGMGVLQEAEGGLGGIAKAGALVGVVLAGAVVAGLGECARLASEFQSAQVQLNTALKDAGEKVTPTMTAQLEALEAKMRLFGRTDKDTVGVIAQLTEGGLSWSQAMSAMGPIADLAAAKHLDLATATKDVLLATQGSSKALKELGITLPPTIPTANQLAAAIAAVSKEEKLVASTHGPAHVAALKALEAAQAKVALITEEQKNRTAGLSEVLDALSGKLGGSASAQAGTFGGHMAALRSEVDHAAVQIGTVLIPYLNQFLAAVAPIVPVIADWATTMVSQLMPQIVSFAGWLKSLGPDLQKAWNLISTLKPYIVELAAVWVIWNVAMAATKALSMITFLVQLISQSYIAASATKDMSVAQWLLNVAMDANPIGLVTLALAALVAGVIWAYQNVGWFRDIVNDLGGAFAGFASQFWADIKPIFDWIGGTLIPLIQQAASLLSHLGGSSNTGSNAAAGRAARVGMIPAASGFEGIVTRPTLFLAGEGGSPERVSIGRSGSGSGATINLTYHITGVSADIVANVKTLIDESHRDFRRMLRMGQLEIA